MKSSIPFLLVAVVLMGCVSPYDHRENWILREDAVRPFAVSADVIYVQDRLYLDINALPDMQALAMEAVGKGKFSGVARVFSPLVATEEDVAQAVEWYIDHHNHGGRHFVLIGEGKGGALLKAYAEENAKWLSKKGLVASFYSDVPDRGFVSEKMVQDIKNVMASIRYRQQWGKEAPEGMFGE